jgi:hypothetical protein
MPCVYDRDDQWRRHDQRLPVPGDEGGEARRFAQVLEHVPRPIDELEG